MLISAPEKTLELTETESSHQKEDGKERISE